MIRRLWNRWWHRKAKCPECHQHVPVGFVHGRPAPRRPDVSIRCEGIAR